MVWDRSENTETRPIKFKLKFVSWRGLGPKIKLRPKQIVKVIVIGHGGITFMRLSGRKMRQPFQSEFWNNYLNKHKRSSTTGSSPFLEGYCKSKRFSSTSSSLFVLFCLFVCLFVLSFSSYDVEENLSKKEMESNVHWVMFLAVTTTSSKKLEYVGTCRNFPLQIMEHLYDVKIVDSEKWIEIEVS